jgi:hypothetical protein
VDEEEFKMKKIIYGGTINGCCGGGCFVIHGIKFCPFCGKKIFEVKK